MNLIEDLNWRYATKRMNGTQVSSEKIDVILEAIRLAPTSLGLQPIKVAVVDNKELLGKIYQEACQQPQVNECSHLLVFAAYTNITEQDVEGYISLIAETRNIPVATLDDFKKMILSYVSAPDAQNFAWAARQAYIALGAGIVAAAVERVDATPMEGFNPVALDSLLGLDRQNLKSVVLLALGYRDESADYLVDAKKVRKSSEEFFMRFS